MPKMTNNCNAKKLTLVLTLGTLLATAQIAVAETIATNETVAGSVSRWSSQTWTFDAAQGDAIAITLSDVAQYWWWFSFPAQIQVSLTDEGNAVIDSATCGTGLCLEASDLDAGQYSIVIEFDGFRATYGLALSSGYCLEVSGAISWPYPCECDPDSAFAYGAKNYATLAGAQAGMLEEADNVISAGSCQSLVAMDCSLDTPQTICGKDMNSNDEEAFSQFDSLCGLKNSVKARALGEDVPDDQNALIFYVDGEC